MSEKRYAPQFTPQISLGNVITILGGIVALVTAWNEIDNRVQGNTTTINSHSAKLHAAEAVADRIIDRIRQNEIAITRQDERTNSILTGLARIEGQLARMNQRLDRGEGQ